MALGGPFASPLGPSVRRRSARIVFPLHPTVRTALDAYLRGRAKLDAGEDAVLLEWRTLRVDPLDLARRLHERRSVCAIQ